MDASSGALIVEESRFTNSEASISKTLLNLFDFTPIATGGDLLKVFSDCFLFNLHFNLNVKHWPGNTPPPHPGLFADCFPTLLREVVGTNAILTLFVKSLDPSYFDELDFVKTRLVYDKSRFVLLPRHHQRTDEYSIQRPVDLFFEWSPSDANFIVEQWFMSPQVSIEGYVSSTCVLAEIVLSSHLAVNSKCKRDLLRSLVLAFRLWPDFNGMSIVTDKLQYSEVVNRIDTERLKQAVQSSISGLTL